MTVFDRSRRGGLFLLAVLACAGPAMSDARSEETDGGQTEILWDAYGIPHVYGSSDAAMYYGFGRAQAEAHGNLILTLYAQARGRGAEFLGDEYAEWDEFMHRMDVPARSRRWVARQNPDYLINLQAFARGINDYLADDDDALSPSLRGVLPVTAADVLAHMNAILNVAFVGGYQGGPRRVAQSWQATPGSNMWLLAPSRTVSEQAILLVNPHLSWSGFQLFFEAHLNSPGLSGYGITLVGFPVLMIAFNDRLGWAHTVNKMDGADYYELTLADGGYRFDGAVRPFVERTETLRIRRDDGSFEQRTLTLRESVHGYVIAEKDGKALALRLAGLDEAHAAEQYHQMLAASDLDEFEEAIARLQIPMFHIGYADRQGNILFLFGGRNPKKPSGDWDYWQGVIPGDTARTLWHETIPYPDLPKLVNPPTGWIQNANDPPWWSTQPVLLRRDDYPAYLSSHRLDFRPQRSLQLIQSRERWSFDDVVSAKFSNRLAVAERLLDDLLALAEEVEDPTVAEAVAVLADWDRSADADSRGTALFVEWYERVGGAAVFSTAWRADDPYATPAGIAASAADNDELAAPVAALRDAAVTLRSRHGVIDPRWGEVQRFRVGKRDLPADGADGDLGAFRQINSLPPDDRGHRRVGGGDTYVGVWQFGQRGVHAKGVLAYGNASQPGSPHIDDQIELFATHQLRAVLTRREAVEQSAVRRERHSFGQR